MTSFDTSAQTTAHGGRASTTLLKLQADERLVAHVRRGNQAAFEVLVSRYESRLLAFCRHMLGAAARRDAEDVLQEVFTSAYRAMLGDNRPINVRPWLYRIARNRCLNHLRRDPMPSIEGMEMTVVDERIGTPEIAHQRAEVRQLLSDIQALPETQRTAILLREIDDLSYEQIAMAMDNTVAAVKSLLVRARVGLAEAAESRRLSCDDVRIELGEHAEGLVDKLTPATRRHLKDCKQCSAFREDIKDTTRTLSMLAPAVGILALVKGLTAGFGHAGTSAAGTGAAAATVGSGSLVSIGGVLSAKTMTGLAAAVAVTGAAVEVRQVATPTPPAQVSAGPATSAAAPGAGGITPQQAPASAPVTEWPNKERSTERKPRPTTPQATTPPTTPPATPPQPAPAVVTANTPPAAPPVETKTDVIEVVPVEEHADTATVAPPPTGPVTTTPPKQRPPAPTTPPAVTAPVQPPVTTAPQPTTPPAAPLVPGYLEPPPSR